MTPAKIDKGFYIHEWKKDFEFGWLIKILKIVFCLKRMSIIWWSLIHFLATSASKFYNIKRRIQQPDLIVLIKTASKKGPNTNLL